MKLELFHGVVIFPVSILHATKCRDRLLNGSPQQGKASFTPQVVGVTFQLSVPETGDNQERACVGEFRVGMERALMIPTSFPLLRIRIPTLHDRAFCCTPCCHCELL